MCLHLLKYKIEGGKIIEKRFSNDRNNSKRK